MEGYNRQAHPLGTLSLRRFGCLRRSLSSLILANLLEKYERRCHVGMRNFCFDGATKAFLYSDK